MEQTVKVTFDVYKYNVFVVYTDDIAASREERKHILGKGETLQSTVDGLHSYNREEFDGYIFFTPYSTMGVIAHECSHAITRMFKFFGAKVHHEHFEYHLDYLVDKAVDLKIEVDKEQAKKESKKNRNKKQKK